MTERRFFGNIVEDKMVQIPANTVSNADIAEWYKMKEKLAKLKSAEALLRTKIFKGLFVNPDEGTNTLPLNDGTGAELKAQHVINRSVDEGALDAMKEVLREKKIPVGKLIRWKPELAVGEYRKLTDEERQLFDQVLIIKPGSPQLDVVVPKSAKAE
jgi:hypothetical protein